MENTTWTRQMIFQELIKSPHGKLIEYKQPMETALQSDAEFCAHLIAWNHEKGTVYDSKIALPLISICHEKDPELLDNALAHLAMATPRDFTRALRNWHDLTGKGIEAALRKIRPMLERYLRVREQNHHYFNQQAVQYRKDMHTLYTLGHIKPSVYAKAILFEKEYPANSVFHTIAKLSTMLPNEIGQAIGKFKLPFLVVTGALGARLKEPELLLGILGSMSQTEVITNAAMLKKMGVMDQPECRAAFEVKLAVEMAPRARQPVLKTTRAAEAVQDTALKEKLLGVQERQLKAQAGIEGNWLILGDRSPSMEPAIEYTRQLAAYMAKMVKGNVHVVFFDSMPRYFDMTGMSYESIRDITKQIRTGSATSIGCGVAYALSNKLEVDGIAIVSDGGENTMPMFTDQYKRYTAWLEKDVPVYYFHANGTDYDRLTGWMGDAGIDFQKFEVDHSDYYSIPNLAQTMRTNRYSLLQEIFDTPLKRVEEVLKLRGERHAVHV